MLDGGPGTWKVGDFGIAKSVEFTDPGLTSTGLIMGTPAYLAPERLAGGPGTVRSDIYAVGLVLYEALVGRRGTGRETSATSHRQPLPPLSLARVGLPSGLVACVTRAIAADPAQRFGSALEMAAFLQGRSVDTPAAATVTVPGHPDTPTEVLPQPSAHDALSKQVRRSLRSRRAVGAALASGVAVTAIGLAISLGGHTSPRPTPSVSVPAQPTAGLPATTSQTSLPALLSNALQRLEQAVKP